MVLNTCMLLYLLNVLKQRGHENCVGPMRIWAGVGIQYWPLLILVGEYSQAMAFSLSEYVFEVKSDEAVELGSPKCKATVTVSSSKELLLDDMLRSLSFSLLTSMALKEDSRSWPLAGLRLRRGSASLGGEDWWGVKEMALVKLWW